MRWCEPTGYVKACVTQVGGICWWVSYTSKISRAERSIPNSHHTSSRASHSCDVMLDCDCACPWLTSMNVFSFCGSDYSKPSLLKSWHACEGNVFRIVTLHGVIALKPSSALPAPNVFLWQERGTKTAFYRIVSNIRRTCFRVHIQKFIVPSFN